MVCESSMEVNGGIRVTWRFDHTGGLPLTSQIIDYQFTPGSTPMQMDGPPVSVGDRTADISSLVAGYTYMPSVNATNDEGSVKEVCPPLMLRTGKD